MTCPSSFETACALLRMRGDRPLPSLMLRSAHKSASRSTCDARTMSLG